MRFTTLATLLITCAAADTARGGDGGPVAEIVTFRLTEGTSVKEFADTAQAMTPFLERTNAVLSRTLSVDDTGLWTDHIVWASMQAATSAAAIVMDQPEAQPFMQFIDPDTVALRHAPIWFSMRTE